MTSAMELVAGSVRLASPPMVYGRLMEVLAHPRSGAADIAKVIGDDSGLTARLLRVVNSAFFGFPQQVHDVSQAVRVVGTTQIRDLALATSVMSVFDHIPRDAVDLAGFWRHSLACGVTARAIAQRRGEHNVERFFVAGVLHDVGHLILYAHAGAAVAEAIALAQRTGLPLHDCEREVLGYDHAQVGRALMDRWCLPPALRDAVAYHHQPHRATRSPVDAAAVHVAEITVHALGMGRTGEELVPPFDPWAWETLGLEAGAYPGVVEDAERQFDDAVHFMGAA
jgi:HD-like signal output (HDOD) protein